MNEEMLQQLVATANRLGSAAESLDRVLGKLDAQQEALNAKVDRIVAAVEEVPHDMEASGDNWGELKNRMAQLEKSNTELRAQAARAVRKTLTPMTTSILAKNGESDGTMEREALEKSLLPLSVEQRIAVKAELARAGLIE